MNLNILLQNAGDIVQILSIEEVSVIGILILFIAYLFWSKHQAEKRHEKEKQELRSLISEAREKQEAEYQRSTEDIKGIIEKYYTISTRVLESLQNKL